MPKGWADKDAKHASAWKRGKEAALKSYGKDSNPEAFYGTSMKIAKNIVKEEFGVTGLVGFDQFIKSSIEVERAKK